MQDCFSQQNLYPLQIHLREIPLIVNPVFKYRVSRCLGGVAGHPMGLWILRLGFESRPGPHNSNFMLSLDNFMYVFKKFSGTVVVEP
jgi:hypothetical protein